MKRASYEDKWQVVCMWSDQHQVYHCHCCCCCWRRWFCALNGYRHIDWWRMITVVGGEHLQMIYDKRQQSPLIHLIAVCSSNEIDERSGIKQRNCCLFDKSIYARERILFGMWFVRLFAVIDFWRNFFCVSALFTCKSHGNDLIVFGSDSILISTQPCHSGVVHHWKRSHCPVLFWPTNTANSGRGDVKRPAAVLPNVNYRRYTTKSYVPISFQYFAFCLPPPSRIYVDVRHFLFISSAWWFFSSILNTLLLFHFYANA